MLRKSLAYTILLLLFQQLVEINCQIPFRPTDRYVHTATYIDGKLYILGGTPNGNDGLKDFFYLDVSRPFNTAELSWNDLSNISPVPAHYGAASVKGGANNNTLILYGGFVASTGALVYTFDPQSNSWNTPSIAGVNPLNRKSSLTGIIDCDGKMYLWGGEDVSSGNGTNNMLTLDTVNLIWGTGTLTGAPISRITYGAVLLPNQNILYIGGFNLENKIELTLNQIFIYNTINDKWNPKTTTATNNGKIPSNRDGLSAVLGLDGKSVIIFGGTSSVDNTALAPVDSLHVLNLDNFEWSIPKVTVSGQIPSPRIYHHANVIGKYMVVSFGLGYDQSVESDILLLDISNNENFIWTDTFDPSPAATAISPQPTKHLSKELPINSIVTIVGSLVGAAILSIGSFFFYKRNENKQRRKEVLIIPGSDMREEYN